MTSTPSIAHLQQEIESSRERLAATIDELSHRATPKALMDRQKASARAALTGQVTHLKAQFDAVMQDEAGRYRQDRVIELAAAGLALLVLGVAVRRRR